MEGTVKWFDGMKGYGFITGDDADYFVHINQLPQGVMLREGDKVEFEPAETERGKQAHNVKVI